MSEFGFVEKLVGKFWDNVRLFEHKGLNLRTSKIVVKKIENGNWNYLYSH